MNILVVGAGFSGAVVARELAEAGHKVTVIDKRDHIAGNAFDYVNEHGIRVHKYGPHLWHTNSEEAHAWFSKFTDWLPYRHKVQALLPNGKYTPLPINNQTILDIFGEEFSKFVDCGNPNTQKYWGYQDEEADNLYYYKQLAFNDFMMIKSVDHEEVTNSREHVEVSVGRELCELFFAPYTKKMWGMDLSELPASVAARIPTNPSFQNEYFPKDKFQGMPAEGYTKAFEKIFDHPNIKVLLSTGREQFLGGNFYEDHRRSAEKFDHIFTGEPIDTYFDCKLGELPWRSIKCNVYSVPYPLVLPESVVNFTHDGPYTRITEWKQLPGHGENPYWTTLTAEEPCDYKDNRNERYYPVKTSQRDDPHRKLYHEYVELAEKEENVTFIGRCGTYQYLDMWIVIMQTLKIVEQFKAQFKGQLPVV
jgi:UDP-galactopyranose mutase